MARKTFTDESLKTLVNETKAYVNSTASKKADKSHTHNYAGSSSAGGAANSANKLNTNAGDSNTPVYFSNGIPVACTGLDLNTTGNAATATKLQTSRSVYLSGGASSDAISFNGTSNANIPVTSIKEAYLSFGGKNISGNNSALDAALIPELGANRFAGLSKSHFTFERSSDGGKTWSTYTGPNGRALVTTQDNAYNANTTTKQSVNNWHRITIDVDGRVYSNISKYAIYLSTYGATGCQCKVEFGDYSSPTVWTTGTTANVSGWPRWNIINIYKTLGSETYGNIKYVRFTFSQTGVNEAYGSNLQVKKIRAYGGEGWSTPSTLASTGNVYSYDSEFNTTFPTYVGANTSNNENPAISQVLVTNGSDSYYRKASLAHLKSSLGSMPASDVYSWAKASSKPSYSYSEISGRLLTGYTTSGKNYAVKVDSSNNLYVNVPWTDTNTTYSSLKNPYSLTISLNGTSQGAYDGSAAKSINITPSSIGAAASSHNHYAVSGRYTGNGGAQVPSYIGSNATCFNMMNGFEDSSGAKIENFSSYADVMMMNNYWWDDVPYATALAIQKTNGKPRAWIAAGPKDGWAGSTELITKNNIGSQSVNYASSAGSVAWGNVSSKPSYYDAKAIKSITRSGTTFTYTCLDGSTGIFTQQDNNTTYSAATSSAAGLMSASDKAKLDGIESKANAYTLSAATSSTLGGVKVGSNITNSSGTISLTKENVTSALGYTPPTTNTTYSVATTSANGLMSSSDKTKLNGITPWKKVTNTSSTINITVADKTEYYFSSPTSVTITCPTSGDYECWIRIADFDFNSTLSIVNAEYFYQYDDSVFNSPNGVIEISIKNGKYIIISDYLGK